MNKRLQILVRFSHKSLYVFLFALIIHVQACANTYAQKKTFINDSIQDRIDSFYKVQNDINNCQSKIDLILEELQSFSNNSNRLIANNKNNILILKSIDSQCKKKQAHADSLLFIKSKISRSIRENDSSILLLKRLMGLKGNERKLIEHSIAELNKLSNIYKTDIQTLAKHLNGPINIRLNNGIINCFIADPKSYKINLHLSNPQGIYYNSFSNLDNHLKMIKDTCEMITNAGMFHSNYQPVGLYIEPIKKVKTPLNTDTFYNTDNFHLYPNGVFFIDSNAIPYITTTKAFKSLDSNYAKKIKLATQSGPMLLIDKNIHTKFAKQSSNDKIRSGVGLTDGNKIIFACTEYPETFYNFAYFLKMIFNCENALFLDGAISKMYLRGYNQTDTYQMFGPMISISKIKKQSRNSK